MQPACANLAGMETMPKMPPRPCETREDWYVLYLKPGCEHAVSLRLEFAGITALNPLLRRKRFIGQRVMEVVSPLFPCYIFARFDPATSYRLISYTRGVRYIVGGGAPLAVPPEVMEALTEKMDGGVIELPEKTIGEGQQVFINGGPFKGFYGIFSRYTNGRQRCLILLESLGWTLEAESWQIGSV